MDTILDSNIFLGDLNFQGTHFAELFAYLKRTGDALVLPTMVMQETSARYKERLVKAVDTARGAWAVLGGIRVSRNHPFPRVDIDKEIEAYQNRLIRGAPGVRVLQYSDVSGIDANEIARRGSQRIRPANQNGEELRDVLLWLLVFQYARQTKRDVAFISGDKGFRESEKQDQLHSALAIEIAESRLSIHFFPDIASFVTSQSLSHEEINAAWAEKYLQGEDLEHRIVMEIYKARTKHGAPELVAIGVSEFLEGIAYKIAPDSDYAELKYKGNVRLTFSESQNLVDLHDWFVTVKQLVEESQVQEYLTGMAKSPYSTIMSDLVDVRRSLDDAAQTAKTSRRSKLEKFFNFEAFLSARIEKEKLVSWQVDDVRLAETDDVPDALKRLP